MSDWIGYAALVVLAMALVGLGRAYWRVRRSLRGPAAGERSGADASPFREYDDKDLDDLSKGVVPGADANPFRALKEQAEERRAMRGTDVC
jgi:hypothetical protein